MRALVRRVATALTRAALRIYPASFRREMGRQIVRDVQRRADESAARGPGHTAAWLVRLSGSLLANALGAWREQRVATRFGLRLLRADVSYALRTLRKSPGFTVTVIATLALCIGANATVLSALYHLVLEPPPFKDADRVVHLFNLRGARSPDNPYSESSWLQYVDLRGRSALVEGAALRSPTTTLIQHGGVTQRLTGQSATADLFDLMGVRPVIGRFFTPDEVDPGPGRVVVLSQTWWERDFDADPNVLGRRLVFDDGVPYTIIGVAPRVVEALDHRARFTIPLAVDDRDRNPTRQRYQAQSYDLWLELRHGFTLGASIERFVAIVRAWYRETADAEGRRLFEAYDGRVQFDLPHPLAGSLYLLQGASLFVFLTGVFNVTILFLVRLSRRRQQLSIRRSLGASMAAIRRLILIESGVLGVLAAAAGTAIAWRATSVINRYLAALSPYTPPLRLDGTVLAGTLVVSLTIVGAMSLVPLELLRSADALSSGTDAQRATTRGKLSARLTDAMTGAQVAIAFVLLIGAGLLVTSFRNVLAVDPGFAADHVVEGRLDFTTVWTFYRARTDAGRLKQRIVEAMKDIPGVDDVGLSMFPMLSHDLRAGGSNALSLGSAAPGAAAPETFQPSANYVSPGFFAAMGIPILAGRACSPQDSATNVVVDELLAERVFGDANPVGLDISTAISPRPERIIGVSGRANLRGPEQRDVQPFYYRCEPVERGWWEYSILLRTSRDPAEVIRAMQDELRAIDPRLPLSYSSSLRGALDQTVLVRRAVTALQATFAGLALVLSLIGVFAVLASSVVERRREIGIRIAVGARRSDVYRLVLSRGLATTSIGMGIGALGAAALSRVLARFLFDVSPTDVRTFLTVGALFVIASVLACLLPARQAARVDPLESVRAS